MSTIEAVLWDFGGVITTSPFEAFNRYEEEEGLPRDLIRTLNATNSDSNAWARIERAELTREGFIAAFNAEAKAEGHEVDGSRVLDCLAGDLRPEMVEALKRCKQHLKVGCITNNMKSGDTGQTDHVMHLFDVVIESSLVGVRKPDPRIYEMACEALGVAPTAAVYLDDLGVNCKPARALGMTTIKVTSTDQALADLETAVGFSLR